MATKRLVCNGGLITLLPVAVASGQPHSMGPASGEVRGCKTVGSPSSLWPLCCILLLFLAAPLTTHGAPVVAEVFPYSQPDGTLISVRVWGDEFYHIVESLDGYTLVRDPDNGAACYAKLSLDGKELISTGVPVGSALRAGLDLTKHIRIDVASARAKIAVARARLAEDKADVLVKLREGARLGPPNNGSVEGIVLLVDFSDEPGTIAPSEIDDYCNQVGYTGYGNNGSVRDYFSDVSDGNLTYTNFVSTVYYRAPQPKSWYDDSDVECCGRARELILDALNDLDSQGFDFSQYDSNSDGLVDAVNVFYAGTRNGPWSYGLWPHSGWLSFSADGVSTGRYQITDIGSSLRLGTFCHENGHMICYWPDLYDYGYESTGAGDYCLMGFGASDTNPAEPCAYMKDIAGWSTTTILSTPQAGLSSPAGVNALYKYEHPTLSNEYYMIENRRKFGRDAAIPDAGLAIWHIDTLGSNDNEQMTSDLHYLVTLVQADGNWDLENNRNYGDATDLWSFPEYAQYTPFTTPNTTWWDGSASGLFITGISPAASAMTFNFGDTDCNGNSVPDYQDIDENDSPDCDSDGVPDECELATYDCNDNTTEDICDIAAETSDDCNGNLIPDECDIENGLYGDCDSSGTLDECEVTDDLEIASGWTAGAAGDTATTGIWERVDPNGTGAQPEDDHSAAGTLCFVTGQGEPGGGLGANDIDGGKTTLLTPALDLTTFTDPWIGYWRWFSNDTGASAGEDVFTVDISNDGGQNWVLVEIVGPTGPEASAGWFYHMFYVALHVAPTDEIMLRFVAADMGGGSLVEAAIDDLVVVNGDAGAGTCPVCGDNVVNQPGEECDGTGDANCPGMCGPPGDPASECTCLTPQPVGSEPNGADKNRYVSLVVPLEGSGRETAIRVSLTSLHHPPAPPDAPNFSAWEGEYRWVNSLNETHACLDSPSFETTFRCAALGCDPEYRDWAGELDGDVLHVTSAAVVPSSVYDVAQLHASCQGDEASCAAVSAELQIATGLFGDVDPVSDGLIVLDVARIVDHLKGVAESLTKPSVHLRPNVPDALGENVGVLDVATAVDAVKGNAYWFAGYFGPCTDACLGEAACP